MSSSIAIRSIRERLALLRHEDRARILSELPEHVQDALRRDWGFWARPTQLSPWSPRRGPEARFEALRRYRCWVLRSGRGFGKTRCGAEASIEEAITIGAGFRGAVAGRTAGDTRDVMVRGPDGLLAVARRIGISAEYRPSYKSVTLGNGAEFAMFSADEPESGRGPQHHWIWADEIASWRYPEMWTEGLELGLRMGEHPRAVITSTPKRTAKIMREIEADPATFTTRGSTYENAANLPASYLAKLKRRYENTQLGKQELYGDNLTAVEGALWKPEWIDPYRVQVAPDCTRLVVAVDPPGGATEAGIVSCGIRRARDGITHGYVLSDVSGEMSPDAWARTAVNEYRTLKADAIVAEVNYGGDMVESIIRNVDADARVILVRATRGKALRAEPVVGLYEQGRIHHVGLFGPLEDELTGWVPDETPRSPNRLDALVWSLTELIVDSDLLPLPAVGDSALECDSPWEVVTHDE
jgi:phage terminase large subunit-like protein